MLTFLRNHLLIGLIFLVACTTKQDSFQSNENQLSNEVDADYVFAEYIKSWQVLAQNSEVIGQNYYPDLLNSTTHKHLYNKSFAQALNLGVYSVDLAYHNNHYGEYGGDNTSNQTILYFIDAVKSLSMNIGIEQYISSVILDKPRTSLSQKDTILSYHKEILLAIKNALTEEKREYQAVLILTGAWIETIYLATNIHNKLVLNPKRDNEIKIFESYILSQKEQLENIIPLLQLYETKPKIKILLSHLKDLQIAYNQVDKTKKYQQIKNSVIDLRTNIVCNSL
jgi:hypothetical protein